MTHVIHLAGGWSISLAVDDGIDPATITLQRGWGFYCVPIMRHEVVAAMQACIRAQQAGEPMTVGDLY